MADPSDLDPDGIARRDFTTTFRGFDQVEVRAFLSTVSMALRDALDRERELTLQLEQTEQRATEVDQLDEHRLTALLGEETARIFEAAREAATEIRGKAETKTAQLVRDAQDEANRMTSEAAEVLRLRTSEAETAAASIVSDAEAQRDRMLADARTEAEAMRVEATDDAERLRGEAQQLRDQAEIDAAAATEAGRQQGRDMVAEAQVVRERILKDLARRRRTGKAQLEQLRAARERLLDAYALVRRTLDEATTELSVAVPEAKLAADAAGRRVEADDDELSVEAIEAELDAGRVAGVPLLDTGEVPATRIPPAVAADDDGDDDGDDDVDDGADDGADDAADGAEVVDVDHDIEPEPDPEPEPEPEPDEEPEPGSEPDPHWRDEADSEGVEGVEGVEGLEGEGDEVEGHDGKAPVDDLFARIRSEVPPEPDPVAADEANAVAADEASASEDGEESDDGGGGEPGRELSEDEVLLERRDRYILGLEDDLARLLKRQLSDDENEKLDLIRRRPAKAGLDAVLPTLEEHRAAFVETVTDTLVLSAASGKEFAASVLDPESTLADLIIDLDIDLDDLASELADALLIPIRERVATLVIDAEGDEALEGVRACYRRWKGNISELSAQYVHTAFNRGVFDATPDDAMVRWVVDPGAGPCPDGEDDALDGPIAKGTAFPTGHLHPPAHPGCRCMLLPVFL